MNRIRSPLIRGVAVLIVGSAGHVLAAEDQPAPPAAAARAAARVEVEVEEAGRIEVRGGKIEVRVEVQAGEGGLKQQQLQQARQMEQILQPALEAELELVRTVCGDLEPRAKQAIKAAAAAAVRTAAEQLTAPQHRPGPRLLDLPQLFSAQLDPVIERHVPAAAAATWRQERDARHERRAKATRLLIVSRLDEELELTAAQREAIIADLRTRWNDAWLAELLDPGGIMINGHRPAPDYAAACIAPHLDERQREAWAGWVRVASWRQVGNSLGWRFPDGPGLRGSDPWWNE